MDFTYCTWLRDTQFFAFFFVASDSSDIRTEAFAFFVYLLSASDDRKVCVRFHYIKSRDSIVSSVDVVLSLTLYRGESFFAHSIRVVTRHFEFITQSRATFKSQQS